MKGGGLVISEHTSTLCKKTAAQAFLLLQKKYKKTKAIEKKQAAFKEPWNRITNVTLPSWKNEDEKSAEENGKVTDEDDISDDELAEALKRIHQVNLIMPLICFSRAFDFVTF